MVGDADTFTVAGNLKINAPTLGDAQLSPLTSKITAVRGSAMIANTKTFTSLSAAFANLKEVGYSLTLRWNEGLTSACGLNDLTVGGTVSILSDSAPMRIPESLKAAAGKKHGEFLECDAPEPVKVVAPAAPRSAVVQRVVRDADSTAWDEPRGGEWVDDMAWTDGVPCGGRTAVFPTLDKSYAVGLSAETHPVGALSMAPGSKIELQASTVLDFGAGAGAECPKVTTITTTTIFDPGNVDCVETSNECTVACEKAAGRNYVLITASEKKGRACVGAVDCEGGDGACPFLPDVEGDDVNNDGSEGTVVAIDVTEMGEGAAADAVLAQLVAMMSASTSGLNIVVGGQPAELTSAAKDDTGAVIMTFGDLAYADLSAADLASLTDQVIAQAGALFGFSTDAGGTAVAKINTGGGTDVWITFSDGDDAASGDDEGGGLPIPAIAGAAGAVVVIAIVAFVVVKSKNPDAGLPTAMDSSGGISIVGNDQRAVQNPLYEQPVGAENTDGYMEVTN